MSPISIKPAYLDLPGVSTFVSLSESVVQLLIRNEEFHKPRILSGCRVAWLVREVEQWAESRPISDRAPSPNTGAKNPDGHSKCPTYGHPNCSTLIAIT
jgi:prophage regulatory protein